MSVYLTHLLSKSIGWFVIVLITRGFEAYAGCICTSRNTKLSSDEDG